MRHQQLYDSQPWTPITVKVQRHHRRLIRDDHQQQEEDEADGKIVLFIKATFRREEYTVFVTDLKRVWTEEVKRRDVESKMKTYAAAYLGNDVVKFLPIVKKLIITKDPSVIFSSDLPIDEHTTNLSINLEGTVNAGPLKWNLDLSPVEGHPGDFILPQFIMPLIASVDFYQKEIQRLEDQLRKKDFVIMESAAILDQNRLPQPRMRSEPYDLKKAKEERLDHFTKLQSPVENLPVTFFETQETSALYQKAMECIAPELPDVVDDMDDDVGNLADWGTQRQTTQPSLAAHRGVFATFTQGEHGTLTQADRRAKKEEEDLAAQQKLEELLQLPEKKKAPAKKKRKI
ncbi:hypothetical protein HDV05_001276 [Chytridiales sp. JEL 0842]|nr:hypothetical protein HDV05_001276 [Chytridiales sp. JEL 0842]